MTEREMKEIVGSFLKKALLPAAVGVGLAISAANCGEAEDQTGSEDELMLSGKVDESEILQLSNLKYQTPFCTSVDGNRTHGYIFKLNAACYFKAEDKADSYWGTWKESSGVKYMTPYAPCKCLPEATAKYMAPMDGGVAGVTPKYMTSFDLGGSSGMKYMAQFDSGQGNVGIKYASSFPDVI